MNALPPLLLSALLLAAPLAAGPAAAANEFVLPIPGNPDETNREFELAAYLVMGNVGIDRTGMLVVRSAAGVPGRSLQEIERAIGVENARRRAEIDATLQRRGLPAAKREEVAKEWAEKWRAAAQPQWWVQRDDGNWQQGPPR